MRECLKNVGLDRGLEIVSMADLPARRDGLVEQFHRRPAERAPRPQGRVTPEQLAREACEIEIDRLQEPIGKQDQYIAAYGGMQFISVSSPMAGSSWIPWSAHPETQRGT